MTDKKPLTPTEHEFKAMCDLLIGAAVIQIADGHDPHKTIQNVIIEVLKWVSSKEQK